MVQLKEKELQIKAQAEQNDAQTDAQKMQLDAQSLQMRDRQFGERLAAQERQTQARIDSAMQRELLKQRRLTMKDRKINVNGTPPPSTPAAVTYADIKDQGVFRMVRKKFCHKNIHIHA